MTYRLRVDLVVEAESVAEAQSHAASVVMTADEGGYFGHISGVGMARGYVDVQQIGEAG